MTKATRPTRKERVFLEFHLAYHLRCLRKDATDPALSTPERLTLVRDRSRRIREIRRELGAADQGGRMWTRSRSNG